MHGFKVGDRVLCYDPDYDMEGWTEGTITAIGLNLVCVRRNDPDRGPSSFYWTGIRRLPKE